ncbi:carboxypeptidase [Candidatus Marinamargulisbacteria bacterium SCGC AG-343-D04]|nr:carboxypeptidase [Candidatus Marinamargulisbacteria bacterium SCGC AG-343-D04]
MLIKLKQQLQHIGLISSIQSQLSWDQETYMPDASISLRSSQLSWLSKMVHDLWCASSFQDCLSECVDLSTGEILISSLTEEEKSLVSETYKDWKRLSVVPSSFVADYTKSVSEATHVWQKARREQSFSMFLPSLKTLIQDTKQLAAYIDSSKSCYDVLLHEYEPGLTYAKTKGLFDSLKRECVHMLEHISKSHHQFTPVSGVFSSDKQWAFSLRLLELMGFDFSRGRQDKSTHPFTSGFHPNDVRLTTRIKEDNLFECITSTIHEGGHGLYEQGLSTEYFGTPLGQSVSLGIHESQSRFWENHVCKHLSFWEGFLSELHQLFPEQLRHITSQQLYEHVNQVVPGLIRIEADEITYMLHIIIRFECEAALFNDELAVEELPELWNALYKEYLGVVPSNDGEGVLQDIHWASGIFGYFPTYLIGSICSAQLDRALRKDISNVDDMIKSKQWIPIKEWMDQRVSSFGRQFSPNELIKRATGEDITETYLLDYLKKKYGAIYGVHFG